MTGFDVLALLVLLVSAAAGWVRGAAREIVSLLSFALAAVLALVALPVTAPIGRGLIDPDWAGTILTVVVTFLLIYFGIRTAGNLISKRAQSHPQLGGVDRFLGLFIGLARALILLGALHLVIVSALPGDRTPQWLTNAATRPATAEAARFIQTLLPQIGRGADALKPIVASSVAKGFSDDAALSPPQSNTTPPAPAAR
jgi:membrane protein required for colicin V production